MLIAFWANGIDYQNTYEKVARRIRELHALPTVIYNQAGGTKIK